MVQALAKKLEESFHSKYFGVFFYATYFEISTLTSLQTVCVIQKMLAQDFHSLVMRTRQHSLVQTDEGKI